MHLRQNQIYIVTTLKYTTMKNVLNSRANPLLTFYKLGDWWITIGLVPIFVMVEILTCNLLQ